MATTLEPLPPPGLYTVAEAAYVAGLDSRAVNNEFEQQVLESARSERLVPLASVYYMAAVKPFRTQMSPQIRQQWHAEFIRALTHGRDVAELGCFQVPLSKVVQDVADRLEAVNRIRDRVQAHPDIAGGEPVFAGTRIKIRHIAEISTAGTPDEEILAEYGIDSECIALAILFDAIYPRRGRPVARRRNMKVHALSAG